MASNLILLGVFGHSNQISQDDLYTHVLTPLLEELQVLPDRILLPTEGNTSIYIQDWAERMYACTCVSLQPFGTYGEIRRKNGEKREEGLYIIASNPDTTERALR
jgi:hypothetical protein